MNFVVPKDVVKQALLLEEADRNELIRKSARNTEEGGVEVFAFVAIRTDYSNKVVTPSNTDYCWILAESNNDPAMSWEDFILLNCKTALEKSLDFDLDAISDPELGRLLASTAPAQIGLHVTNYQVCILINVFVSANVETVLDSHLREGQYLRDLQEIKGYKFPYMITHAERDLLNKMEVIERAGEE